MMAQIIWRQGDRVFVKKMLRKQKVHSDDMLVLSLASVGNLPHVERAEIDMRCTANQFFKCIGFFRHSDLMFLPDG
ncbi:hypothetical protein [Parasphingorhabdus litoris]|nr:hypothetical protein [Parasphingorhabdus litoris]